MLKKTLALLTAALCLLACLPCAAAAGTPALSFRADGTFTILQLTDPQDDAYPARDMLNLVRRAVETANPDLIVISGDLVEDTRAGDLGSDANPLAEGVLVKDLGGRIDHNKTRANVEKAVDAVFSILEDYAVPYVIALGNNDRKVDLSTAEWLEIFAKYPHCAAFDESADAQDGLDYHVTVKDARGADRFNVWLLDTCSGGISDEQVDWYRAAAKAAAAANGGTPVPALAFQHIQMADIGNLFEPCGAADEGARRADGGWVRLSGTANAGNVFYGYAPGKTTYEFEAFKECGDVLGAFFGHQHVEGFSGKWQGIELGFTYGCEMAKTGPYGFRVFTLHENDLANYDNVLYRYTGSVSLGTDAVTAETGTADGLFGTFIARIRDFFTKLISLFASIF